MTLILFFEYSRLDTDQVEENCHAIFPCYRVEVDTNYIVIRFICSSRIEIILLETGKKRADSVSFTHFETSVKAYLFISRRVGVEYLVWKWTNSSAVQNSLVRQSKTFVLLVSKYDDKKGDTVIYISPYISMYKIFENNILGIVVLTTEKTKRCIVFYRPHAIHVLFDV